MLTESEAWRMIGEAFEARAAHPEVGADSSLDLAWDGLCVALDGLYSRKLITRELWLLMLRRIELERGPYDAYLQPEPDEDGGTEARAALAFVLAEAA